LGRAPEIFIPLLQGNIAYDVLEKLGSRCEVQGAKREVRSVRMGGGREVPGFNTRGARIHMHKVRSVEARFNAFECQTSF
jgi:hypothetical protein